MLKIKKFLIPGLVVLASFSVLLSGCGEKSGPSPSGAQGSQSPSAVTASPAGNKMPSIEDLVDDSLKASEKLTTMKFDMDMSMLLDLGSESEMQGMTLHQAGTGSINIADREMSLILDMDMDIPGQGQQDMTAEIYSADGWMYMKTGMPGIGSQWMKMELTEEMWAKQSQVSSMTEFLKSATNMEISGTENINGVECYVLSITPDIESLSAWMSGQSLSGQSGVDFSKMGMDEMFENFKVKQWISRDNSLPVRQVIQVRFNISAEEAGEASGSLDRMIMDMDATLDYYDYGKAVKIELPPEALNAMEIPTEQ